MEEEKPIKMKSRSVYAKPYYLELCILLILVSQDRMEFKSYARRNPFANPDQWMDEDFELLRERAKIYMTKKEWDRALLNLNRTLYFWGAKGPEQIDHRDPPNKQVYSREITR